MFNGFSLFEDSPFTRVSYFFLALFLAFLFCLAKDSWKQLTKIKQRSFKIIWMVVIACFLFGFYLCYPGLMVVDDAFAAKEIFAGNPYTWLSLSYAFLLAAGYMIMGKVGFIPLLSIALMAYLFLRGTRMISEANISEKWRWLCFILLNILSLNPLMQGLLIFHSRDIIFSLAVAFIGLLLLEESPWSRLEIFLLSALVVYISDLRAEGKLYLVLVPLLFYYARRWNLRQVFVCGTSLLCVGTVYLFVIPYYLNAQTMVFGYKVTTWVMPLSQIYHDVGVKNIDPAITEKIDRVLDVELMEQKFSPVDIDAFHAGAFNHDITAEQWEEFKKAALQLFREYPGIFLKNRVNLFFNMLNVGHETFIYYDDLHGKNETSLQIRSALRLPEGDYSFKGLSETYYNFLGWWGRSRIPAVQVFNSLALPLIFCLFCLKYFKSRPEFFCFSVLVLARVPVMFLLAPSSYTRYLFVLLLFLVFGGPLLLLKTKQKDSAVKN